MPKRIGRISSADSLDCFSINQTERQMMNNSYVRQYPPRNPFPLSADEIRIIAAEDYSTGKESPIDADIEYAIALDRCRNA